MAFDFSKIDRTVDLKGLQADVEEAKKNSGGDFPTIPAGKYEVRVETLEVKGTKADPNRPMLAVDYDDSRFNSITIDEVFEVED